MLRSLQVSLAAGFILLLSAPASGAPPVVFSESLETADFTAAGLGKLTAEERTHLDRLIKARYEATTTALGFEQVTKPKAEAPRKQVTRLVGEFGGLSGKTIFELENGQRWRQRDGAQFYLPKPVMSPVVTLSRGPLGYRMHVADPALVVLVERIE